MAGGTAMVQQITAPSPRVTGGVLKAPAGSTIPATALGSPDAAFKSLGRVSNEGLRRTEDRTNTDIQDWGGDLVATLQERYSVTLRFVLIQTLNVDVQRAVHGSGNVTTSANTTTTGTEIKSILNSKLLDTGSWVFDGFFNLASLRLVVPLGRITTVGEVRWVHNALFAYDCTLKCFPDDDGNHAFQYLNDGVTTI
jgi:hypothetical protein